MLLGSQAECGKETLLVILAEYNGLPNDDLVKVGLIPSYGIRQPHDAGELDSSCTSSPDPPFPAKWDGTDTWSFAEGTALRKGNDVIPLVVSGDAYVVNGQLVVPPVRSVTLFLGVRAVELSSPVVVATLVPLDDAGADLPLGSPASGFRISQGLLAGRISTEALLASIGVLKPGAAGGAYLCNDPRLSGLVYAQACAARDILTDPANDFQNHADGGPYACDAVSTGVRFAAQMAKIGNVYSPDGGLDGGCPADWTICK